MFHFLECTYPLLFCRLKVLTKVWFYKFTIFFASHKFAVCERGPASWPIEVNVNETYDVCGPQSDCLPHTLLSIKYAIQSLDIKSKLQKL